MADECLRVTYDLLRETSATVGSIKGELERSGSRRDVIVDACGARAVAEAMEDFHDNWTRHRRLLVENLGKLADFTNQTIEAFTKADAELAASVAPSGSGQ